MRVVVKIGTSSITDANGAIDRQAIVKLTGEIAALRADGHEVLLVSSGAVAAGVATLGFTERPSDTLTLQAVSAVGQSRFMQVYNDELARHGLVGAQVLVDPHDFVDRHQYLHGRQTLQRLLELGCVPIINENDAVVTAEIRVGDNDNLSAMVAGLVDADLLLILTDIAGLYSADPRTDPSAELIAEVPAIDERIWAMAGGAGSVRGTGGMRTKIQAADLATRSGTTVVIAAGAEPDVILRVAAGERLGTRFLATVSHLDSRKRWILAETARQSRLVVDQGAAVALVRQGRSLLPAGIAAVEGDFDRGQTVRIYAPDGREIARGLTQYRAADVRAILGLRSNQIAETLGYDYGPEVVHRDDMVVLAAPN